MFFERISLKKRSFWIGVFILTAYGVLVSGLTDSAPAIMLADVISGLSVLGIAFLVFPLLRGEPRGLTWSYLALRTAEGMLMVAGGIIVLFPDLQEWRARLYDGIHLYVFILGGTLFYILLLRKKLVPSYLSIWGLAGIAALILKTVLGWFGTQLIWIDILLVLIITNEIYLAVWLMVKELRSGNICKNKYLPA